MNALQLLQLFHLADSALPVGTAAHSFGLESLVVENDLEVADLPDFFRGYLQEAGLSGSCICLCRLRRFIDRAVARAEPTHERHETGTRNP